MPWQAAPLAAIATVSWGPGHGGLTALGRSMVGLTALGPHVAARVLLMLAAGVLTAARTPPGSAR
ncbi:hypothetical protein ACFW9V_37630 [Streptomyces hygroscopicus]|uniref:hypothetical protein n=1 Tax=Streptomyces hygroscopicus TaxID=1912 RepID=UPI0036869A90